MKKSVKHKRGLLSQEITYTVDENMDKLKGKNLAPKKLEEANQLLRNLKTPLPK
jgi:hypothetical protein